jgi:hypothetical protein
MEKCENNALSENLLGLLEGLDPALMFEGKISVKFGNSESREMFLAPALFETWLHCPSPHYQILSRLADLTAKFDSGALCELLMESTSLLEQNLLSVFEHSNFDSPLFLTYCVKQLKHLSLTI